MLRTNLASLCLVAVHIATASAQQGARWGDELRPVPAIDSALLDAVGRRAIAWPAPPLGDRPDAVRALYVNAWAFGGQRFKQLVSLADQTEVNALVIDVKDDTGYLTYKSSVPTAIEIGANTQLRARDVRERLAILREHNIYPIARIVVAKDPLLASRKSKWAVQDRKGGLWRDRLNFAWVDAYNDSVWVYAAQLAAEAVRMGFAEVQYDYVRLPDEPRSRMAQAMFTARDSGETARSAVKHGLGILKERTKAMGVPFTIDIFGLTTSARSDMGIGQWWEDLVTAADVVLPMVYPSHYFRGYYDIKHPNSEPYRVIRRALQDGLKRSAPLGKTAEIRPYLQAFTLGAPRYEPVHVREQIRAAAELGIKSWVLWNPRSAYDVRIFQPVGKSTITVDSTPVAEGPVEGRSTK